MEFKLQNFFTYTTHLQFDGLITDPPYKNCIKNQLNENQFNIEKFFKKSNELTKENAFLIIFTNFSMSFDLRLFANNTSWNYCIYMIWNKSPVRTWISWTYPLRTCEFILFFSKGNFKYNFKNEIEKKPYKRKSFGGKLKETQTNKQTR